MFNWFKAKLTQKKNASLMGNQPASSLLIKDPNDFTLTESSSVWDTDQYCTACLASVSHRERMADVCNSCGDVQMTYRYRSYRKIWNGKDWIWQYKYWDKIVLSAKQIHTTKEWYQ